MAQYQFSHLLAADDILLHFFRSEPLAGSGPRIISSMTAFPSFFHYSEMQFVQHVFILLAESHARR